MKSVHWNHKTQKYFNDYKSSQSSIFTLVPSFCIWANWAIYIVITHNTEYEYHWWTRCNAVFCWESWVLGQHREMTESGDEWEGGWHAAKGPRSDLNPWPLQQGQGSVSHSANWATGASHMWMPLDILHHSGPQNYDWSVLRFFFFYIY